MEIRAHKATNFGYFAGNFKVSYTKASLWNNIVWLMQGYGTPANKFG